MLTAVRVYRPDNSFVTFSFDNNANDFFVKNISGLGVDRSVVVEDSVTVPGGFFQNTRPKSRNVVMKLGYSNSIVPIGIRRREIMSYFVPGTSIRMEFDTDNLPTVQLYGVVETADSPIFSQDPDITISILCSNPYFEEIVDTVRASPITASGTYSFQYNGTVPVGVRLSASRPSITGTVDLHLRPAAPVSVTRGLFYREPAADSARVVDFSSVLGDRYVKIGASSVLDRLLESAVWPQFQPGLNQIQVVMTGVTWTITNFRWRPRYEGL